MSRIYKEVVQEGEKVKRWLEEFVVFEYDEKGCKKSCITEDKNRLDDYDNNGNIKHLPLDFSEPERDENNGDIDIEENLLKEKFFINEKYVKTKQCFDYQDNSIQITDKVGNVIQSFYYDGDYGDIENVVFDDFKNLISYKQYHDDYKLEYDGNQLIHILINSEHEGNIEYFFEYSFDGLLSKKICMSEDGEDKFTYEYNENKRFIHVEMESDYRKDYEVWYEYDENGNLCCVKDSNKNFCKYKYDSNNNLIVKENNSGDIIKYSSDGNVLYRKSKEAGEISYKYDENGTLLKIVGKVQLIINDFGDEIIWSPIEQEWDANGRTIYIKCDKSETYYKYNKKGIMIQKKSIEDNSEEDKIWDESGRLTYKKEYGYEYFYDYNSNGVLIKKRCSDGTEKQYNDSGKLIFYKDEYRNSYWCEYDEDNNVIHYKDNDIDEWYEYELWENGNIKKKICYRAL